MRIFFIIYVTILVVLCLYTFWERLWSIDGLFYFHKEKEYGHMLCTLGTRYSLNVLGKSFTWVK